MSQPDRPSNGARQIAHSVEHGRDLIGNEEQNRVGHILEPAAFGDDLFAQKDLRQGRSRIRAVMMPINAPPRMSTGQ